jgi:hypothetical protein
MSDIELEDEFTDEDESVDEKAEYGRLAPPRQPSQVYSIRIPVNLIEELRHCAAEMGVRPSSLMRDWVVERLEKERRPETHFEVKCTRVFSGSLVGVRQTFWFVPGDWRDEVHGSIRSGGAQ